MKLRLLAIAASTALVPAVSLAQTSPAQTPQSSQARPAQPGTQAPAAADFVNKAAISNMFEIQSSQLAQQKSQNDRVRQFAQRMVQDHTAATDKLKSTAQGIQGVTVPTSLDQPHQQMMQTLQNSSGAGFDRAYVQMQVTAHRNAVTLFDQYAQNGDNPQFKQFAQQTVPSLREHLQSVEQIQNALPPAQVGATQGGNQQTAQSQGGQDPSRIVVQQPAPTVRVDQASPQVTVQQQQPQVTVNQPQPEILVRQPQPTVTVDIPQPEIIVRMPQPDVNVAMAQPQVEVNQPQPQVQIQQPQQPPQVQVERAQPQVQVQQQANAEPNVQVQRAEGQPQVRYERAEPRVVVNQPQGQPQVRIERMGEGQQTAGVQQQQPQSQQQAAVSRQPADTSPQATGALPGGQALAVSRVTDMDLYNARGNELGDVERVVQGQDGKQYLVVGAGGFLGIGERDIAVPTDRVAMQGDRLVIQGVTEDQLRAMQPFDSNNRNFRELDNNQQVQFNAMR
jgi:predicted outer membrane protein/sporulation protein YlmC with PRC-barrel domain